MYMFNLQHNIHTFFQSCPSCSKCQTTQHSAIQKCHNTMTYLQYPPLSHTNPSHLCIQQPPLPESPCILPLQIPSTCDQSLERWPKRSTLPRKAPPWSTDDAGPAWWDHSDIKQGSILRIYNSYIIKKNALDSTRCVYFGCYLVVKIQSTWLWQHTFG